MKVKRNCYENDKSFIMPFLLIPLEALFTLSSSCVVIKEIIVIKLQTEYVIM